MKTKIYKNLDVKRVIAFIPKEHVHVRIYIEFKDQSIILQEATIDAILRAYINVSFHPYKKAYELILKKVEDRKPGYAEYQHIESDRSEDEVINEMMNIFR